MHLLCGLALEERASLGLELGMLEVSSVITRGLNVIGVDRQKLGVVVAILRAVFDHGRGSEGFLITDLIERETLGLGALFNFTSVRCLVDRSTRDNLCLFFPGLEAELPIEIVVCIKFVFCYNAEGTANSCNGGGSSNRSAIFFGPFRDLLNCTLLCLPFDN